MREQVEARDVKQVLMRAMVYSNTASNSGDKQKVVWTEQEPHQDASWLSLIVESAPGLLTRIPGLTGRDAWVTALAGGMSEIIVMVGGRLAEGSRGFYPSGCHGVAIDTWSGRDATSVPRFTFPFLYTSNCCDFQEMPGIMQCRWLPPESSREPSLKEVCLDRNLNSCRLRVFQ